MDVSLFCLKSRLVSRQKAAAQNHVFRDVIRMADVLDRSAYQFVLRHAQHSAESVINTHEAKVEIRDSGGDGSALETTAEQLFLLMHNRLGVFAILNVSQNGEQALFSSNYRRLSAHLNPN